MSMLRYIAASAVLAMLTLLMPAEQAQANSYCMVYNGGQQCGFRSQGLCEEKALEKGAYCVLNPRSAAKAFNSVSQYCVASSFGLECNYSNFGSCLRDAELVSGGCVENREYIARQTERQQRVVGCGSDDPAAAITCQLDELASVAEQVEEAQQGQEQGQ